MSLAEKRALRVISQAIASHWTSSLRLVVRALPQHASLRRAKMKIPYNRVYTQGSILFAARGGSIHSFSLLDGTHVSTWQHPDVAKVADALKAISDERIAEESKPREQGGVGPEGSEPPAKRQKCEDEGGATAGDTQAPQHDAAQNSPESKDKGGKDVKKRKDASGSQKRQVARVPDRPVITQLIGTADERHVLAVSGHDKIIWVFDHDGQGELTLSSQRYDAPSIWEIAGRLTAEE